MRLPHLSHPPKSVDKAAERKTRRVAGSFLTVEEREDRDENGEREPNRPPGHFMEEQYADDTARFLAEVKRLAERRRRGDEPETWARP